MKVKKFSLEWPEELHTKFKSECALAKKSMNNILRVLAVKWLMVQENEKEVKE